MTGGVVGVEFGAPKAGALASCTTPRLESVRFQCASYEIPEDRTPAGDASVFKDSLRTSGRPPVIVSVRGFGK